MKKFIFVVLFVASSAANAWWGGGYGPGWGGYGWGGYGVMPYGLMGYGWPMPSTSFNYNTVVQQAPPIIINETNYPPQQYQQAPVPPNNRYCKSSAYCN